MAAMATLPVLLVCLALSNIPAASSVHTTLLNPLAKENNISSLLPPVHAAAPSTHAAAPSVHEAAAPSVQEAAAPSVVHAASPSSSTEEDEQKKEREKKELEEIEKLKQVAKLKGLVSFTNGTGSYKGMSRQFVDGHNKVRERYGVPPMKWNNKLARYARRWSNAMRKDCQLLHSAGNNYGESARTDASMSAELRQVANDCKATSNIQYNPEDTPEAYNNPSIHSHLSAYSDIGKNVYASDYDLSTHNLDGEARLEAETKRREELEATVQEMKLEQ
ncbi:hypothetical protein PR202_gb22948 [Eleusine coracana subsp. coracana]|uniref:SCP domain-containing protein n=1 Tax=Eleusine coracana subsp. coracana TaxID=191504 RepID=A0AAV5FEZ8_ELECO|nr:hypothetical protein PR202_gb22948 [Eleusine coracana subsp. coracana]